MARKEVGLHVRRSSEVIVFRPVHYSDHGLLQILKRKERERQTDR
tara:strand:+ start:2783 stop:2917 length:135 start_codon:yes stop_codon:yes gene_type:complete